MVNTALRTNKPYDRFLGSDGDGELADRRRRRLENDHSRVVSLGGLRSADDLRHCWVRTKNGP